MKDYNMDRNVYIKNINEPDDAYIDLYEQYGVRLAKGAFEEFLLPAAAKEYVTNESRIKDGVQYFANNKVKEKDISIKIIIESRPASSMPTEEEYIECYFSQLEGFLDKLSTPFCLKIPVLKRVYKLVYKNCSDFRRYQWKRGTFTLSLTECNPRDRERL